MASEECPGCGCMPGDGYTVNCYHPTGCGYFKNDTLSMQQVCSLTGYNPEGVHKLTSAGKIVEVDDEQFSEVSVRLFMANVAIGRRQCNVQLLDGRA